MTSGESLAENEEKRKEQRDSFTAERKRLILQEVTLSGSECSQE